MVYSNSQFQLPRRLRNATKLQEALKVLPESYWRQRGNVMALRLFHDMASRVPAYKKFLHEHGINPANVKTVKDFSELPVVNKDNYLRKYPRQELCWDGKFGSDWWVISTTSGSTGEPFYFPRTNLQDEMYALSAELYLRENFDIQHKKTLYIDAFAMGAWIGGLFTYEAIKRVAQKGYSISIITPGVNKAEVINDVRKLGPDFDQVIIGCYPPILKDIIDLGKEEGLNWKDYNLGVIFSAEGFSEDFRDYVVKHGSLENVYTSNLNHYGTVDLGTMSHETATSIMIRRQAVNDEDLFRGLFGDTTKQPTFTQYFPEMFYFEEVEGGLVCSSYGGLPLVRYDLKDKGSVLSMRQVEATYQTLGKDLALELRQKNIEHTKWNLPFVYLYERSDFSVTFSGAQIYPEEIRRALLEPGIDKFVTGKLTLFSGYDKNARNYLQIHVELRKGVTGTSDIAKRIEQSVVNRLIKENSEYRVLYGEYKKKLHPRIKLWPHEHPTYFSGKGKQQWVKK